MADCFLKRLYFAVQVSAFCRCMKSRSWYMPQQFSRFLRQLFPAFFVPGELLPELLDVFQIGHLFSFDLYSPRDTAISSVTHRNPDLVVFTGRRPYNPSRASKCTLPSMNNSADNSNNPFQKGDPFKTKNYNKLLFRFSAAVIVILFLSWLLLKLHIIHF